jgi:hypothetical protein
MLANRSDRGLTATVCAIMETKRQILIMPSSMCSKTSYSTCDEYKTVLPTPFPSNTPHLNSAMPSSHCHLVSSGTVISSFQAPISAPNSGLLHHHPVALAFAISFQSPVADPDTLGPAVGEVQSSWPSIPFAFTEMQGTEQCTALGSAMGLRVLRQQLMLHPSSF